jgi:hypothetical protein
LNVKGQVERRSAVEGLVDIAAGHAEQIRNEPCDPRIVVGDDDAATLQSNVGAGPTAAPCHSVGAG